MESVLLRLWRNDRIRSTIASQLDTASLCALRLTQSECSELISAHIFKKTRINYSPSSFTRQSRLEALSRIGGYIEHLNFSMPHTPSTFLPPLLHPFTGREVNFLYSPLTSSAPIVQRPKYGTPELGDMLTEQYPPIFHAATNVPSFISAMSCMPNLRHLSIECPGQDPAQRYRRDAVDYALISLRIAVERTSLPHLHKLTLNHVHPSSLLYFRHMSGFGCTPAATKRWRQLRKLSIFMDSWDFHGSQPGLDHLKILDDYIRAFSDNLEKVSFGWNGGKGPCPYALFDDPLFDPPRETAKLFAEVTSPMSPLPSHPRRPMMNFPKLRMLQVRNAVMSVRQVANLVEHHKETVREFDFENVILRNEGSWDEALASLVRTGNDEWSSQPGGSETASTKSKSSFEQLPPQCYEHAGLLYAEVVDTGAEAIGPALSGAKTTKRRHHRRRKRKHRNATSCQTTADCDSRPTQLNTSAFEAALLDPGVPGVQRNLAQDAVQQALAEDPELRVSVLKRAKEAVLKQLSKEFCHRNRQGKEHTRDLLYGSRCSPKIRSRPLFAQESSTALVPLMFTRC